MCVCIYASLPSSCQDARVPALHLSGRAQAHSWSTTETGVTKIPTLPAPPSLPSDRRGRGPRGYPLPPPHRPGPPGTPRPLTPAAPHKRPGPPALAAPEGVSARARGGGRRRRRRGEGEAPALTKASRARSSGLSRGVATMPLRKPAGKRRSTDSGVEPDRGALSQEKKHQRIALFLSDFDQQGRAGGRRRRGLRSCPASLGGRRLSQVLRRLPARVGVLELPSTAPRPATALAGTAAVLARLACLHFPARRWGGGGGGTAAPGEKSLRAGAGARRAARRGEPLALSREGRRQAPEPALGPALGRRRSARGRPGGRRGLRGLGASGPQRPAPPAGPPWMAGGGPASADLPSTSPQVRGAALVVGCPHRASRLPKECLMATVRRSDSPVRSPRIKRYFNFLV